MIDVGKKELTAFFPTMIPRLQACPPQAGTKGLHYFIKKTSSGLGFEEENCYEKDVGYYSYNANIISYTGVSVNYATYYNIRSLRKNIVFLLMIHLNKVI